MPTIEGVVSAVSVKERNTPYGAKNATSFQVDGTWYSGGFKSWEVDKGDEVRLSFETNAKGYPEVSGIAVLAKGAPTTPANTGVPRPGRSFPIDALAPERTINRQNALTAAAHLVGVIIGGDGVAAGADYADIVISYARRFEAYTTGDLDAQEVQAMVAGDEKVA